MPPLPRQFYLLHVVNKAYHKIHVRMPLTVQISRVNVPQLNCVRFMLFASVSILSVKAIRTLHTFYVRLVLDKKKKILIYTWTVNEVVPAVVVYLILYYRERTKTVTNINRLTVQWQTCDGLVYMKTARLGGWYALPSPSRWTECNSPPTKSRCTSCISNFTVTGLDKVHETTATKAERAAREWLLGRRSCETASTWRRLKEPGKARVRADPLVKCCKQERRHLLVSTHAAHAQTDRHRLISSFCATNYL